MIVHISIREQKKKYGVLKAIGANATMLRRVVISETLYRAVLGFVLSIGPSLAVAELIMRFMPQFTVAIRPEMIAIVGSATIIMALISAFIPLRHVMAIDPSEVFSQ